MGFSGFTFFEGFKETFFRAMGFLVCIVPCSARPSSSDLVVFQETTADVIVQSNLGQNESGPRQICDRRKGRHQRHGLIAKDGLALNPSNNERTR